MSHEGLLNPTSLYDRIGRVVGIRGLSIESQGPDAFLGEVCRIDAHGKSLLAEVVGFQNGNVMLTPFSDPQGIAVGAKVTATGKNVQVPVGSGVLGRVVDALGVPLDDLGALNASEFRPLHGGTRPVLKRQRISAPVNTGVTVLDTFLPLGKGQRIGLFAGSGVGKSTLLGMITRGVEVDVNVVALIGERGREVREFIEDHLGEEGMKRSVVVVATADASAVMRLNAAYYATVLAEYFREQGRSVLLTMDSLTRLAMARREIGLAAGEPPTSRGYTPSVFSELPALCERCGTSEGPGAITGIYTVLVEGDDFNEPISDTARATLDGHVMLSRELSSQGQYPPVDVLNSVSRLASSLWTDDQQQLVAQSLGHLANYERNRQLIEVGAYRSGVNVELDRAVAVVPALKSAVAQRSSEVRSSDLSWDRLKQAATSLTKASAGAA